MRTKLAQGLGGLSSGLGGGGAPVEGYTLNTLTPANIATITGKSAPTYMWRGNEASGATELVAGTANLAEAGTPSTEVDDATLGGLTFETAVLADGLVATDASLGDVAIGETITILSVFRYTVAPTASQSIIGNISSGAGWEIRSVPGGAVVWGINDGGAPFRYNAIAPGLGAQTVLCTRSVTDNVMAIWTKDGTNTGNDGTGAAITGAHFLTVGNSAIRNPAYIRFGFCAIWLGSSGDGFGESERLAVAEALGYE